jgi:hypothetical protein
MHGAGYRIARDRVGHMEEDILSGDFTSRRVMFHQRRRSHSIAIGATAVGAVAVGAFAIGALAIGRLAIGRAAIGRAVLGHLKLASLDIDELTVTRLTVREVIALPERRGPRIRSRV